MPKPRPKTGERRETRQPLKIDRLPPSVHDSILFLRNVRGKTWQEIEALSAEPVKLEDGSKGDGFIDWPALDFKVLELFPDMRLPHTSLHRWYDLRVAQVQRQVLDSSIQARKIAEAFVRGGVEGDKEGVINAARDQLMSVLSEDGTVKGRMNAAKGLIVLAEIMQSARANDIKERKVQADERKLKLLEAREARAIRKLAEETERLTKKAARREITVEDINRIRERTFGLPPVAKGA
ncbi:MAG: hypothetical protein BGO25_05625 [Acidobacteriales bacterium 59-55]|nr:hypothetical protein [Terriglobales bacterium]ODU52203.1 MAG: hypothetical protein ABT07_01360 [Microbacterium sp. SCN 70-10]OJV44562.1 MAG: hypothetical protein BGO25_05625 [Acidobacteriales bacterium 59-55]